MSAKIDPHALVHPLAVVEDGAEICAGAVIGKDVVIKSGTVVGNYVIVQGPTIIGMNNHIHAYTVIGGDPQDKKYQGELDSRLEIGNNNTIREYCTINRGTGDGGGFTRLGDNNWIMANVHIAHDCRIGNNNTFANYSATAGHVVMGDYVTMAGYAGIHQFCQVGSYSFAGVAAVVVKDLPPYMLATGNHARIRGLNKEGLRRHGFSPAAMEALKQAYKLLYRDGLTTGEAITQILDAEVCAVPEIKPLIEFIDNSTRGIVR